MKFSIFLIFFLIPVSFVACSPALPTPVSSEYHSTDSITPKLFSTDTFIPTPTRTSTLQPTITLVPTLGNSQIDVPMWLRNPVQEVLMYRMLEDEFFNQASTIHFLNPSTGEEYEIEMPDSFICWHDSTNVVFVHNNHDYPDFITIFDLISGTLTRIMRDEPSPSAKYNFKDWICDFSPRNGSVSKYDARVESVNGKSIAVLINIETGEKTSITEPNDNVQDDIVLLSPDQHYVAVIQIKKNSTFATNGFWNQISIYRTSNLELITIVQDNALNSARFVSRDDKFVYLQGFHNLCVVDLLPAERECLQTQSNFYNGSILISSISGFLALLQSDNPDVLFSSIPMAGNQLSIYDLRGLQPIMVVQDKDIHDMWFLNGSDELVFMRGWEDGTPCIVDAIARTKKCVHEIPTRFPGSNFDLEPSQSDKKNLAFLHWNYYQNILSGGFCLYNLQTGVFNCPMEELPIPGNTAVTEYRFSPKKDFIVFTYEDSPPHSDAAGLNPGLAVVGIDGKNFSDLGFSHAPHDGGLNLVATWRPISVSP